VYRQSTAPYEGTVSACHPDQFRHQIKALQEIARLRAQCFGKY
jgi:hypothetical protein